MYFILRSSALRLSSIRRPFSSSAQSWPRLKDHLKLETIEPLPSAEIGEIWIKHFSEKESTACSAVIDDAQAVYMPMLRRLRESPLFIIPLPRVAAGEAAATAAAESAPHQWFNLLMQAQFPSKSAISESGDPLIANSCSLLFTSLAEFQRSPEAATVSLKVDYFTELIDKHNLVLMHGFSSPAGCLQNNDEAVFALNVLKLFYLNDGRYALPRQFNHEPDRFDMANLFDELSSAALEK